MPGVIDEQANGVNGVEQATGHALHIGLDRNIRRENADASAGHRFNLRGHCREAILVSRHEHEVVAAACELPRKFEAEAGG